MRMNIDKAIKIQKVNDFMTATVAGTNYPASGSFIDVSDFTHFAFLILIGTLDTELTAQVRQDTSATATAEKSITGAVATIAAGDDNKWLTIEVEAAKLDIANDFRFVSLDIAGAAGANDFLAIVFLGWNARHEPVTQPSDYDQQILVVG